MFILANWKIAACVSSSGATVTCLCGHVFGNPQFKSGEFVQTSTVTSHRIEFDSLIVATRNGSEYWLGKPDPAEAFAMQRLLRYLQDNESVPVFAADDEHTRLPAVKHVPDAPRARADGAAVNLTPFRRRSTDMAPAAAALSVGLLRVDLG